MRAQIFSTRSATFVATLLITFAVLSTEAQTFSVIYSFNGNAGAGPEGNLVMDGLGKIYGTSNYGGSGGSGTVYKLSANGAVKRLYTFTGGADGGNPDGGVIRDAAGNLYGPAESGGAFGGICGSPPSGGCGVIFRLDTAGKETVLYAFAGGADGWRPFYGLSRDSAGNLYGTTQFGGTFGGKCGTAGCGVVFKLSPNGTETVLHAFTGGGDGFSPSSALVRDPAGNFYGTTGAGGIGSGPCATYAGCGVIYRVDKAGKYSVLYWFTGGSDGMKPSSLIRGARGNLYGGTNAAGDFGFGTIFKLDTTGKLTVLYSFSGTVFGPSTMFRDAEGNLYGAAAQAGDGSVFKLDTTGTFTLLHTFSVLDGQYSLSGLISDKTGNLYGTTYFGGKLSCGSYGSGCGVVYKIGP